MSRLPPDTAVPSAYKFSADWFTPNIPLWEQVLAPYRGVRDLGYLEVGVHEGRSLIWMLEQVLTGPGAYAVGLGIFPDGVEETLHANLALCASQARVEIVKGDSRETLRALRQPFQLAYIDASHTARGTLRDALDVWDLIPIGGLVIFDDYGFGTPDDLQFRRYLPDSLRPRVAIDAFVTAYRDEVRVLHRGWQVVLERVENRCFRTPFDASRRYDPNLCTALGHLVYNWQTEAFDGDDAPALAPAERVLLEQYLNSCRFGEADTELSRTRPPRLERLFERLGLELQMRDTLTLDIPGD